MIEFENRVWITGKGEVIRIKDMSDKHIANTINYLIKTLDTFLLTKEQIQSKRDDLINFQLELIRRKGIENEKNLNTNPENIKPELSWSTVILPKQELDYKLQRKVEKWTRNFKRKMRQFHNDEWQERKDREGQMEFY